MDKAMRQYYQTMTRQIESQGPTEQLRSYHAQRLGEFQHERLVHLLVTLFFAGLTLLFAGVFVWILTLGVMVLSVLAGLLAAIVFVVELFYIAYYYRLENGVQKLYQLTDRLFETND